MDKRKFLVQIARGRTPKQVHFRMYCYKNGVKTLLHEEETDWDEDIEVTIVTTKEELADENKID